MSDPTKSAEHRREFERKDVLFEARVAIGDQRHDCEIVNVSFGGIQIRVDKILDYGEQVELDIDPFGSFLMEVRWFDNRNAGLRFEDDRTKVAELVMAIATYA